MLSIGRSSRHTALSGLRALRSLSELSLPSGARCMSAPSWATLDVDAWDGSRVHRMKNLGVSRDLMAYVVQVRGGGRLCSRLSLRRSH
jgi:hypothetical protein